MKFLLKNEKIKVTYKCIAKTSNNFLKNLYDNLHKQILGGGGWG